MSAGYGRLPYRKQAVRGPSPTVPLGFLTDGTCSPLGEPLEKQVTVRVRASHPLRGFTGFQVVYEARSEPEGLVEEWVYYIPPDRLAEAITAGAWEESVRG